MNKNYFIQARCNEAERLVLNEIARAEHLNPSETLRLLVRERSKKMGIWPPNPNQLGGKNDEIQTQSQ